MKGPNVISECNKCIKENLSNVKILKCEEITLEEFGKELVYAYYMGWIEHSKSYIFKELGIKIEPDSSCYGLFEGPPYKVEERIYSSDGVTKKKSIEKLSGILASNSFHEEIDRIYSKQNEKRFMGHPVHYLITAGDKAAADDMIAVLIPALLKNKRLLCGRVCDVQNIKPKAYRDDTFFNIFSVSKGGTVILNLSGEADLGMYATGYHTLIEQIGKKLGEYGNDTLFIFVDVSEKGVISNDTIGAILTNADMVQINEGYGNINEASLYLEHLAEETEYKDYQIEDITQYLPKNKTLYSVSDIFTAYNKWYGSKTVGSDTAGRGSAYQWPYC